MTTIHGYKPEIFLQEWMIDSRAPTLEGLNADFLSVYGQILPNTFDEPTVYLLRVGPFFVTHEVYEYLYGHDAVYRNYGFADVFRIGSVTVRTLARPLNTAFTLSSPLSEIPPIFHTPLAFSFLNGYWDEVFSPSFGFTPYDIHKHRPCLSAMTKFDLIPEYALPYFLSYHGERTSEWLRRFPSVIPFIAVGEPTHGDSSVITEFISHYRAVLTTIPLLFGNTSKRDSTFAVLAHTPRFHNLKVARPICRALLFLDRNNVGSFPEPTASDLHF